MIAQFKAEALEVLRKGAHAQKKCLRTAAEKGRDQEPTEGFAGPRVEPQCRVVIRKAQLAVPVICVGGRPALIIAVSSLRSDAGARDRRQDRVGLHCG